MGMARAEGLLDLTNPVIAQQFEVINGERTSRFIADQTERLMKPINESWQPHGQPNDKPPGFLPSRNQLGWEDRERAIMAQAAFVSRELVISEVFHLITEENLPGYMRALNMFLPDYTGSSTTPQASQQRIWVAQEKKHGLVIFGHVYLGGRVNMAELDRVIGHQINNGFNMGTATPYECFVFTSGQERKTKKTHGRSGREAKKQGDETYSLICNTITGDEATHERFYVDLYGEIFDQDANGATIAFRDMMRRGIFMPSHLIDDGRMGSTVRQPKMFLRFGRVDEYLGVFDFYGDSADDMGYFMKAWNIEGRGVTGEAAEAQEELVTIHQSLVQKAEKSADKPKKPSDLSAFDMLVPPNIST